MNSDFEAQVAKIQTGNPKTAATHVLVVSEPADGGKSELYLITELPMFNPAAFADCERIAQSVANTLRRSYRKTPTGSTFENTLANINEELGKLASLGKDHWIGKLNAIVAVRTGATLQVATAGKVNAFLLRDDEFVAIADQSNASHPLKTFENFSVGKLLIDDMLVFSTPALLNHISIDRLKSILYGNSLATAGKETLDLLEDALGPEAASGTIFVQLAPRTEPQPLADDFAVKPVQTKQTSLNPKGLSQKILEASKTLIANAKPLAHQAAQDIAGAATKLTRQAKNGELLNNAKEAVTGVQNGLANKTKILTWDRFVGMSKPKKFFLLSALILLIALIVNVAISGKQKARDEQVAAFSQGISELEQLLTDADSALLYKNEPQANELLDTFRKRLETYQTVPVELQPKKDELAKRAQEIQNKIDRITTVTPTQVATLSPAEALIDLPTYIATTSGTTIISYNKTNGATEDNKVRVNDTLIASAGVRDNLAAIHNGTSLALWDPTIGRVDRFESANVPAGGSIMSMVYYQPNSRLYVFDKSNGNITSFPISDRGFASPILSVQGVANPASATDFAIDGSIYIYVNGEIVKYTSGRPDEFNQPTLSKPLGSDGRLYTQNGWNGLYVLDIENNRILILNKTGELVQSLESPDFSNLKDFVVDEPSKTIYVLNEATLFKITF